ncbi:hypothetical protein AMK09_15105 [Streptomyces sp. CB02488]|nr:hypothetical protein AMK09_15105 [Streptomyces sp. CB02488]
MRRAVGYSFGSSASFPEPFGEYRPYGVTPPVQRPSALLPLIPFFVNSLMSDAWSLACSLSMASTMRLRVESMFSATT